MAQAEPETIIEVELTGGDHAGSFEVTQQDSSCLYGTSNGDDWRTLYSSNTSDAGKLSTALLLIPNTTEAAAGSTSFFFSAGIGEYGSDAYLEYVLDPPNGNGTGTVTVQRDGDHATLSVTGQTAAGVGVSATITCNQVLEVGGEPKALSDFGDPTFGPDGDAPTGSLDLTIDGKHYLVQTGAEVSCARDPYGAGEGQFAYSYYLDGYTGLDLFILDLEAAANGTADFGFALDNYTLIYRTGEGTGTVKTTQTGDLLTLAVEVTSPEGIPVQATLECMVE